MATTDDLRSAPLLARESVLTRLEAIELRIREAEAERLRVLADAFDIAATESTDGESSTPQGSHAELSYRAMRAEVAVTMHQSEYVTERMMNEAYTLTSCYPRTFEAYEQGVISRRHTVEIMDAGNVIGGDDGPESVIRRAIFEEQLLPVAAESTPNRLRRAARELAEQYAMRTIDERHDEEKRRRRVTVSEREDGMAELNAYLPSVQAHAIYDRLTRMAKRVGRDTNERDAEAVSEPVQARRSRDEIRTDLFSQLLLEGSASEKGIAATGFGDSTDSLDGLGSIRSHVHVIVPHTALAPALGGIGVGTGVGIAASADVDRANVMSQPLDPNDPNTWDDPAAPGLPASMLAGSGPIDSRTAKRLAREAKHWTRVIVNAETGVVLSTDRYRPTKKMRRQLIARDQICRFPGCAVPAARCEIDHTIDAALGGSTITTNLACLCASHHALKHGSAWTVEQHRNGDLTWTSPSGRTHRDKVRSRVRFVSTGPPNAPSSSKLPRRFGRPASIESDDDPPPF